MSSIDLIVFLGYLLGTLYLSVIFFSKKRTSKSFTLGCIGHGFSNFQSKKNLGSGCAKMDNLCSNVVDVTSSKSTPPHATNSLISRIPGARACRLSSCSTNISKRFWKIVVSQKGRGESSEAGGICRKSPHSNNDLYPNTSDLPSIRFLGCNGYCLHNSLNFVMIF